MRGWIFFKKIAAVTKHRFQEHLRSTNQSGSRQDSAEYNVSNHSPLSSAAHFLKLAVNTEREESPAACPETL